MTLKKLLPPAVTLAASVALAAGLFAGPPAPDAPPVAVAVVQPPAPKAAPRPLPKGPNKIVVYKSGKLVLLDPDGKNETVAYETPDGLVPGTDPKLAPDGKRVAFLRLAGKVGDTPPGQQQRRTLVIRPVGGKGPAVDTGVECEAYSWSPDGARLATSQPVGPGGGIPEVSHDLVDATTGGRAPLKLPSNHIVTGWLPGDRLLTTSMAGTVEAPRVRLHLMNLDGTEHRALTDETALVGFGLPSPDGARVLCFEITPPAKDAPPETGARRTLVLLDAATGKRAPVEGIPLNGELQGFCWSPDGAKIAYTWRQVHEGTPEERLRKETESHLVVAAPDGRNPRTILTEKGDGQWVVTLGMPDWR